MTDIPIVSDPTLLDAIRWVITHELLSRNATHTYPAQIAMYVGRHFGTGDEPEPRVADVAIVLGAMGLPSRPHTFRGRRVRGVQQTVTVPMFDLSSMRAA